MRSVSESVQSEPSSILAYTYLHTEEWKTRLKFILDESFTAVNCRGRTLVWCDVWTTSPIIHSESCTVGKQETLRGNNCINYNSWRGPDFIVLWINTLNILTVMSPWAGNCSVSFIKIGQTELYPRIAQQVDKSLLYLSEMCTAWHIAAQPPERPLEA